MRDIRSDLQERETLIEEQIRAAHEHFQKILEQLQNERDAKIADLKSDLAMIAKFMEFEQWFLGHVSPPLPSDPLLALADLFMHKLNEVGAMSRRSLSTWLLRKVFSPTPKTLCSACTLWSSTCCEAS